MIFVALTACTINLALSQIMYNKVKPYSYNSEELLQVNQLPTLEYNVSIDGNLSIDNLNVNVKEKALLEKKGDKYVSRLKFKVNARKLGEISLYFKDVKLANGTTCYVYTTDYKIVAGPITQQSINGNYLTIMKLPADELILETVFNSENNYNFTLNGVNYFSAFEKKEYDAPELQSEIIRDYECNYGEVKYFEHTQLDTGYRCEEFGFRVYENYFKSQSIRSINDFQFSASRASCIIFRPLSENHSMYHQRNYIGENAVLINFPYRSCGGEDDCGVGLVLGIYHNGGAGLVVNATDNNDNEYLDKMMFRFNLHHKYGTPWNLQEVDCKASVVNFERWRESIDWDEVIDYCGATLFFYDSNINQLHADIYMLKMKQKPFYKEHHIGWSSQLPTNLFSNQFYAVGRKGALPTYLLYGTNKGPSIKIEKYSVWDAKGFSGSILTSRDSIKNNNELMAYGLLKQAVMGDTSYATLASNYFSSTFNNFDSINFFLNPYCSTTFNKIDDYLSQSNFYDIVHDEGTYKWMPSAENKTKCPSTQGFDPVTQSLMPCSFDTVNMFSATYIEDEYCISINGFQSGSFPESKMPAGYRIYHNFGDQKTVAFDSYATDYDDLVFPFTFCINKCDMLYFQSIGRKKLEFAIDFYDSTGRVLNNPVCKDFKFEFEYPVTICDLLNLNIEKIVTNPSNCIYRFGIKIDGCGEETSFVRGIIDSLKYNYSNYSNVLLSSIPGIVIDYSNDSISFEYQLSNPDFEILFDEQFLCVKDSINFELCRCDCMAENVMQEWVNMDIEYGDVENSYPENDCPDYMCHVDFDFNIPTFYDCFTHYAVEDSLQKFPLQPDGSINYEFPCIYKGFTKTFKFYLYRELEHLPPCVIEKTAYCPLPEYPVESCMPDCEEVPFQQPPLIKEVDLNGCPGCKAIVEYTFRTSTCFDPVRQDLQVLSFKLQSDDPLLCSNCSLSPSQIYTQAIHRIILDNDMGFKPTVDKLGCDTTWRVIQSTCWAEGLWARPPEMGYPIVIEEGMILPWWKACNGAGCCIKDIIVCRSAIGITVNPIGGSEGTDTCGNYLISEFYSLSYDISTDEWKYGLDTSYCEDKCDWLNALQVFDYTGKQVLNNDDFFDNSISENFSTGIKEYPDYMDVQILSKLSGSNVKISIVNLFGNEMNCTKSRLKSGFNNYILNTNELNTGMYYIYISVNGTLQSCKKFIIIR